MINGVGVVIFNDANVMTTDDIVTSCQRDRTQPARPVQAGVPGCQTSWWAQSAPLIGKGE